MKKLSKYLSVALLATFSLQSCDDYLDVNDNPNDAGVSSATPQLVLPGAQTEGARRLTVRMNQLGNTIIPNWANNIEEFITLEDETRYVITSSFYSDIWEQLYWVNANFDLAESNSISGQDDNYIAIAKIMKSFYFQYLVDLYGDIPYSEAFQRDANLTPVYDDAESVYRNLIVQLDDAIDLINNAGTNAENPGANDVMLGGNMNMWIKLANTIKLRILIRESNRTDAAAQTYISNQFASMAGAQFLSAGDNVFNNPGYTNGANNRQNPFFGTYGADISGNAQGQNIKACDFALDYLVNTNDNRLSRIYSAKPDFTYEGLAQDAPDMMGGTVVPYSGIGPGLLSDSTQDAIIFTAAESLFLQAEAVERGYLAGNAQTLYESAISESFALLGAGGASTYYGQAINNVSWASSSNKIEAIITQKWIALNGINGIESWIEHTRTGFPTGMPIVANATSATRPIRLLYPSSEIQSNSQNVPAQTTSDAFSSPIFWNN